MRIRKARQILKAFGDDTRMRIINLLNKQELNVAELYRILGKSQSNASKHLTRLRLLGIVGDRRVGLNVYYYLPKTNDRLQKELLKVITVGLAGLSVFEHDLERLKELKKSESVRKRK